MKKRRSSAETCPMRLTGPVDEPTVVKVAINKPFGSISRFGDSGKILARTCMATLMMRKWQDCYWVHELPATLLLFRSESDFQNYRQHGKKKIIKLVVDFDTLGLLQQQQEYKSNSICSSSASNAASASASAPKLVSAVQKYSLADVHTKLYGKQALHSFKLERLTGVGVDTVGAFASERVEDVRALRRVIYECIKITSKSRSKLRGKQSPTVLADDQTQEMTVSDVHSLSLASYQSYRSKTSKSFHTGRR